MLWFSLRFGVVNSSFIVVPVLVGLINAVARITI
jgi:hypothetical protein